MSLNFNFSKVATRPKDSLLEVACFTLLAIGQRAVTVEALDEIEFRCAFLTRIGIYLMVVTDAENKMSHTNLSREQWEALVGLTTTVTTTTRARFIKGKVDGIARDVAWDIAQAKHIKATA